MNSKTYPILHTATEVRRSIQRLESFKSYFTNDQYVADGTVDRMIEALKEVWRTIPVDVQASA